ncbi:MAG: glycosyltransferase family 2 protein, partial [Dehalococcoidia bacterium]|nr:glycosyltransferase family 2 protein [Dehalococcoidia bacterium]
MVNPLPAGRLDQPFLSIVIPAFNEQSRLRQTLATAVSYLEQQPYSWEILVVDDGSTDDTPLIAADFAGSHPGVSVVRNEHRGKGYAVKTGMLAARGCFRFQCDADLSMSLEELPKFLPPNLTDYDIAIGSREVAGAKRLDEPFSRHLMAHSFNLIIRLIAVRGLKDTQCGFKCFRGEVAQRLFPLQTIDGFGFDGEILFLAQQRGLRIVEVPIVWHHRGQSKVHPFRDT